MIATIATIARVVSNMIATIARSLAIVAIVAIIWKPGLRSQSARENCVCKFSAKVPAL